MEKSTASTENNWLHDRGNKLDEDASHISEQPTSLKARIKAHYDLCSSYYYSFWGEHVHHGLFDSSNPSQTKEAAQTALINLLLTQSSPARSSHVLDVGCGLGGTSRHLARDLTCTVTGITISSEQVRMSRKLSGGSEESEDFIEILPASAEDSVPNAVSKAAGKVRFLELDAENLGDWFISQQATPSGATPYDAVWVSEALSHFPNKALFFRNAARVLRDAGRLVIADWFRAEGLSEKQVEDDIRPIEGTIS